MSSLGRLQGELGVVALGLGGYNGVGGSLPHSLQALMDVPVTPRSWDRKNNPEPWNKLSPTDQYKVSTG